MVTGDDALEDAGDETVDAAAVVVARVEIVDAVVEKVLLGASVLLVHPLPSLLDIFCLFDAPDDSETLGDDGKYSPGMFAMDTEPTPVDLTDEVSGEGESLVRSSGNEDADENEVAPFDLITD